MQLPPAARCILQRIKRRLALWPRSDPGDPALIRALLGPVDTPAVTWMDKYFVLQQEFLVSLEQVYGRKEGAAELIRHAVWGSIKPLDAWVLADLITARRPARILEIGSYLGFSTRWLLDASRETGGRVTSVDPRVRHRIFDNIKDHLLMLCAVHADRLTCLDAFFCARNDHQLPHDYLTYEPRKTLEEARKIIAQVPLLDQPFGEFDFAFIDGEHDFRSTLLNLRLVAAMMPSGGYIVVHDALSWPEVLPAIESFCSGAAGVEFEGVGGQYFRRRYQAWPALRDLTDGLGLIRVIDGAAAARFDAQTHLRASAS